jgi:hypothetical protein
MGNDGGFTILVVAIVLLCNGVLQAAIGLAFVIGLCWVVFAIGSALFSTAGAKAGRSGGKSKDTDKEDKESKAPVNGVVTKIGTI